MFYMELGASFVENIPVAVDTLVEELVFLYQHVLSTLDCI